MVFVLIYNTFAEFLSDEQANEGVAQHRREAFGSKARTDKALDVHPKLKAVCASVALWGRCPFGPSWRYEVFASDGSAQVSDYAQL